VTDPADKPVAGLVRDAGGSREDLAGRLQRVHPLSPLLRGGIVVVAMLLAAGRQLLEGGSPSWPLPGVLAVVVAVLGWGALSWWTMRFWLGTQTLLIESGILVRRSRRIRLDRVQAVEVQQPFLARLFGMAELAIETAGSGTEATLAYLRLDNARRLRADLLERAAEVRSLPPAEASPVPVSGPALLYRVAPGRLLLSQLVRTAPLVTVALAALAVTVMVALDEPLGITVLVPAAIAVATAVGRGFVGQYGFQLTRTSRRLAVRAGLLDVRSQSIPVGRVQGLVVLEPLVWRWLGWCEVQVTVAGVEQRGEDGARLTSTLLPVIERLAGYRLAGDVLGTRHPAEALLRAGPRRARWLDPLGWPTQAVGTGDDLLVTRRGVVTRRTDLVPRHKIQSFGVRQGPAQRWLGLATLHAHLPPGPVGPEARHREAGELWGLALAGPPTVPDAANRTDSGRPA